MAIFTSALIAGFLGVEAGFFTVAAAFAANLAVSAAVAIGLNYVAKALSGKPPDTTKQDGFGTQGTLAAGGDIPRSFGLGMHMTAGSLVYANYWGQTVVAGADAPTPNAYLTQVIALSDLPREALLEVWVDGEKVTLLTGAAGAMGAPVDKYRVAVGALGYASTDHLWIKYYDGTQTAADPFLVASVGSTDRPYPATRVGTGVCYAICTSLVEEKLFSGFPSFKFVLSGIPLYDPSKDSTNGGSGAQRWSTPSTWGGDGDQLPAVQIYNVLRGIRYNSQWLYGLQNMTGAARLPAANWNAQIAKCRTSIIGESGAEPSYRTGGQINVSSQPANAIEALLTGCQGRLSEIGGSYKIHLGAPDSPSFSWADADLLSSEEQVYRPFFGLADSVNGIQGTYPDPAQGWEVATAPALYRTDLEAHDGNRRLMANPSFDFVPYRAQVQRLQKSGIEEAQRARTHVLAFPPAYWVIEPGDVGTWDSFRNGYVDKLFRVDSVTDRGNLDVVMNVTEIDPTDYDWNHVVDFTGVSIGPTIIVRPPPQGVVDWYAEGALLYDADGLGRRPAIRIAWDGSLSGVVGVQYEVRLTADLSSVTRGRTDQLQAGALLISQGLIEQTAYQVRGQYLPSAPRDMLWSDWLDVVTPDVPAADIPAWIAVQVTSVMDYLNDRLLEVEQRIATYTSRDMARNWTDHKETRSQMSSRTDSVLSTSLAEISHVEEVMTSADAALASSITTVSARVDNTEDDIDAAQADIITNATAIANTNSAFASYSTTTNATIAGHTTSINTHSTSIASIEGWGAANYGVTLDVNGYSTGFELLNGGGGISSATFVQDKFQIAAPGIGGGAAVGIFTVANVNGTPKIAIRSDVYADGSIFASRIVAGSITGTQIAADTITSGHLQADSINTRELAVNSVDIFSLIDGAASNTSAASGATGTGSGGTVCSLTLDIKNGRAIIWAIAYAQASPSAVSTLTIDGGTVRTVSSPTIIMHYATGLSDGNHTFALTVTTGSTAGYLVVNNPRR